MDLRFERRTWTLVYVCLGVIEGGTAAVMVRSLFGSAVGGIAVDLVVAVVSAAPAWANVVSLAYARRAQGQPKIRFLRPLLAALAVCVAGLALLPVGGIGLAAFLLLYGAARVLWAGIDTVRSVIWSVNYPRHLRARITGRIMVNGSIALAGSGLLLGWLLEHDDPWYRAAILAAAASGLAGSVAFGRFRVRQEQRLLADELTRLRGGARFDLAGIRQLLASDATFRRYMLAMSIFGAGHLMLTPLLVVCIDDVLRASEMVQIAITAALPILVMPVAIQPWARFLDRHHVLVYRSVHAWIAVAGAVLLAIAILAGHSVAALAGRPADGDLARSGQPRLVARAQRLCTPRGGDPLHGAARHPHGSARAGGAAGRDPCLPWAAAGPTRLRAVGDAAARRPDRPRSVAIHVDAPIGHRGFVEAVSRASSGNPGSRPRIPAQSRVRQE
jgi:hypothetical protein